MAKYKITIEKIEEDSVDPQYEMIYTQVIETKDEQDIKSIINNVNA